MFTEGNDFVFFNANDFTVETAQLTLTLVNPYDGATVDVDETYILPTETFDGLGGFDIFVLDNSSDKSNKAIFLEGTDEITGDPVQNFINIEQFATFNSSKIIINLASTNFSLGDLILGSSGGDAIIWSNDGNDEISTLGGDDHVHGGAGDDLIITGAGNDVMLGGDGSDRFLFNLQSMETGTTDVIIEGASNDINVIEYTDPTTDIGDLTFTVSGTDLHITSAGHTLILQGQFSASNAGIDTLIFEDSSTFDLRTIDGNSDPVAVDDDFVTVEDTVLNGNVLVDSGNGADSDPNSDSLSVQPDTINTANGGTVNLLANGDFIYTPALSFIGSDSFDYTLLDGNGGSDTGTVNITVNVFTIEGTNGNDTLVGTPGDDIINGNNGNDTIDGDAGNDTISGGAGNDKIRGQAGDDEIFGDGGDDKLYGNYGDDILHGGTGTDRLYGNFGNDILNGGAEKDVLFGGDDNDILNGDGGNDRLNGDAGDDTLNGGVGSDTMFGGEGNDTLNGEDGNDVMRGNNGNDVLNGGDGRDRMFGDAGDDTLNGGADVDKMFGNAGNDILNGDAGDDTIRGGDDDDQLFGGQGLDRLFGEAGNDTLVGGTERDVLFGGTGNDNLSGGSGRDNLFGEDGDDILDGGDDFDFMQGGNGNDILIGGAGNDKLFGDADDDILIGGAGFNRLTGGTGNDTFVFEGETAFGTGVDQVLDFTTGDRLDISDILEDFGFDAVNDAIEDWVRVRNNGGHSFVQIDSDGDGGAANFANVVKIHNQTLDMQDMINDGSLIIDPNTV